MFSSFSKEKEVSGLSQKIPYCYLVHYSFEMQKSYICPGEVFNSYCNIMSHWLFVVAQI